MSVAQLDSLYSEAVAALESGDYDAALRKALACKFRLATMANSMRSLGGGGSQQLQWANAAALDIFIAECRKLKAQSLAETSGLQQTKVTYARAGECDDFNCCQ